jgi:sulfatase maturation enzyme AslB (radical SAM superfamily)
LPSSSDCVRSLNVPGDWTPDQVALALTDACNLTCAYCEQSRTQKRILGWDSVEAAVARLWAGPPRPVRLLLTGGEPLLAAPLLKRIVTYVRRAQPPGRQVRLSVLTNGTLIDAPLLAFFTEHDVHLQVSMDGVETSQHIRGHGTFGQLDRLFSRLQASHAEWAHGHLCVALTLVPQAAHRLAESVRYLVARSVREILVTPVMGSMCEGWSQADDAILDEQFRTIFEDALAHYRRTGQVPLALLRRAAKPGWSAALKLCGAIRAAQLAVGVDGVAYGCAGVLNRAPSTPELTRACNALRIGNVADVGQPGRLEQFSAAVASTRCFSEDTPRSSSHRSCSSCSDRQDCFVCPLVIASCPGDAGHVRVPDFTCAFNRTVARYRRQFPALYDPASIVLQSAAEVRASRAEPQAEAGAEASAGHE